MKVRLWIAFLLLCLAGNAWAAKQYVIQSSEINLRDFARVVANATGRTILYGPEFNGQAFLEVPKKQVTADELWAMFLSALAQNNWGVVVHGKVVRIVPRQDLSTQDSPVIMADEPKPGMEAEELITATFALNHVDPTEAAMKLAPDVGPEGKIVPLPAQGRLIVVATAANVEKIKTLLETLDRAEKRDTLEVIRVKHADATRLAEILNRVFSTLTYEGGRYQMRDTAGGLVVLPESGTGSVVLRGDERDVKAAVRLAGKLDGATDSIVLIRQLENADVTEMTKLLNQLGTGK